MAVSQFCHITSIFMHSVYSWIRLPSCYGPDSISIVAGHWLNISGSAPSVTGIQLFSYASSWAFRPLSHKTHGGLRLVSGPQPLNATTRTLSGSDVRTSRWCCHSDGWNASGSDVRTPRWCPQICKTLSSKYIQSYYYYYYYYYYYCLCLFQQTDILLRSGNCIVFKVKRRWLLCLYVVLKSCRNH
jgi:hypothetical protein